ASVAFAVPDDSLGYWRGRLESSDVTVEGPSERFDERVLEFRDPSGTRLELVAASDGDAREPVEPTDESSRLEGTIPHAASIRGLHGVSLLSVNPYATAGTLETLGFDAVGEEGD